MSGVEQTYLNAQSGGLPTYVTLPEKLWTPEMFTMCNSVVRLDKAPHGHNHSGVYWQEVCDAQCRQADLEPVGEQWPSIYKNKQK